MKWIFLLSLIWFLPTPTHAVEIMRGGTVSLIRPLPSIGNEPSSQITMMAWAYSTTSTISQFVVAATSTDFNTFLRIQGGDSVRCTIYAGGVPSTVLTSAAGTINPLKWNHLACVYNGASHRIFVNGRLVASAALSGALDAPVLWGLGEGPWTAANLPLQGSMTDAMVFSRGLSDYEIMWYFHTGQFNRSGLVHYWPLQVNFNDYGNFKSHATSTVPFNRTSSAPGKSFFRR